MSLSSTIAALEAFAKEAATVAPIVGLGQYSAIIGAAASAADAIQTAVAQNAQIASTTDKAALDELIISLLGAADQLNAAGNAELGSHTD